MRTDMGKQAKSPIVLFFPEASFGAILNCITLAQELRARGVTSKFLTRVGFAGVFRDYGFEEHILPADHGEGERFWAEFLEKRVPHFSDTPLRQIETLVEPTFEASFAEVSDSERNLAAALENLKPDVIVIDDIIMYPAIAAHGCPWVRLMSTAETEIPDPAMPPYLSALGLGEAADEFQHSYLSALQDVHERYNDFRETCGVDRLPAGRFIENSPYLNIVIAPGLLRFDRADALREDQVLFLEHNVRREYPFAVPKLPKDEGPLVYVSFGSLGSLDSGFIQDLIAEFADIPARFMVNVGGRISDYTNVPDNTHLQAWFPQPSVISQCDLFIHHGGLSSSCEALLQGVPSLVIPYFWDGHDLARRIEDKGAGRHLSRNTLQPGDVSIAITELLADTKMKSHLRANMETMQNGPSTADAASRILALVHSGDAAKPSNDLLQTSQDKQRVIT